jgi:broad specificity phosphatase PhoE
MTIWHWVRHGPTHARSFVGWRDVPADLSDEGQILRLKQHLPKQALMISSDLSRARQTADTLMGAGHKRLPHDPHLREINFGIWDGMPFEAVSERDPDLSAAFWEEPGDILAPLGESWNMTTARVNAVVDRINHKYPSAHIIAVAHLGVILTQLQRATGTSPRQTFRQNIDNFSVTRIDWTGEHGAVRLVNHLP